MGSQNLKEVKSLTIPKGISTENMMYLAQPLRSNNPGHHYGHYLLQIIEMEYKSK